MIETNFQSDFKNFRITPKRGMNFKMAKVAFGKLKALFKNCLMFGYAAKSN